MEEALKQSVLQPIDEKLRVTARCIIVIVICSIRNYQLLLAKLTNKLKGSRPLFAEVTCERMTSDRHSFLCTTSVTDSLPGHLLTHS